MFKSTEASASQLPDTGNHSYMHFTIDGVRKRVLWLDANGYAITSAVKSGPILENIEGCNY